MLTRRILSFHEPPGIFNCLLYLKYYFVPKSGLTSPFAFQAPSQPPGNVIWNATDTKVVLNWEQVKAMENESQVTGYKVSCNLNYFTFLALQTCSKKG